jgi:threonine/homoserine/homoserine lactone efflux protein
MDFCIIGLTTLLATSMVAFMSFKLMGAAYLIYLGARMWMTSDTLNLSATENIKPLMNLINPKGALIFWLFFRNL